MPPEETGNISLVATSNMPQPHAQAAASPGAAPAIRVIAQIADFFMCASPFDSYPDAHRAPAARSTPQRTPPRARARLA